MADRLEPRFRAGSVAEVVSGFNGLFMGDRPQGGLRESRLLRGICVPALQMVSPSSVTSGHRRGQAALNQTSASFLGFPQSTFIKCPAAVLLRRRACQDLNVNRTLLGQDVIVIGYQWCFRRCGQRCEFSIVRIRDHDKSVWINVTGKLTLWPE